MIVREKPLFNPSCQYHSTGNVVQCLPNSCFHKSNKCAKRGTRLQHRRDLSEWRLRSPFVSKQVVFLVLLNSSTSPTSLKGKKIMLECYNLQYHLAILKFLKHTNE